MLTFAVMPHTYNLLFYHQPVHLLFCMLVSRVGTHTHTHLTYRCIHTCCSCVRFEVGSYEGLWYWSCPVAFDSYCLSLRFFQTDHKTECAYLILPPPAVCFISFALLRGNLQCLWRDGSSVSLPTDHQTSLQLWPLTAAYTASLSSSSHQAQNTE